MIKSNLLSKYPNVTHGFSCRTDAGFTSAVLPKRKDNEAAKNFIIPKQVHSDKIELVSYKQSHEKTVIADALITFDSNLTIGVRTADCVPILLISQKSHMVGVIHAGWKGTRDKIAAKFVLQLQKLHVDISTVEAAIGPHIGMCCYRISDDRFAEIKSSCGLEILEYAKYQDGRHIDLGRINARHLLEAGIDKKNLDVLVKCTSCQAEVFFSYRREGSRAGRMVNFISINMN